MSLRLFSLLFTLLTLASPLCSQTSTETAKQEIERLKAGVLLVKLKTGELQIKALQQAGNKQGAEELQVRLAEENKFIMQSFKRQFTFCPVLFFYSSDAEKILNKKMSGYFLNEQLQPDTMLVLGSKPYLVAEFGFSDQQKIEGLLIMDKELKELEAPFPFLIRKYAGVATKRNPEEMILLLDKQLSLFYQKR
jgi:hypothetical protein